MSVLQLAVFIEHKPGRLFEVTKILGDAGVNIRGFSISDTEDYGIFRVLADDPVKAGETLRKNGFMVSESQVTVIGLADVPGGFAKSLTSLTVLNINIEYIYIIMNSYIAIGVENSQKEFAEKSLKDLGVKILTDEDIKNL